MPAAALPAGLGGADLGDVKERVQAAVQRARKQLGMGRVNWGKVGAQQLLHRLPGRRLAWSVCCAGRWLIGGGLPCGGALCFLQIGRAAA
jgi:hypothetical protein